MRMVSICEKAILQLVRDSQISREALLHTLDLTTLTKNGLLIDDGVKLQISLAGLRALDEKADAGLPFVAEVPESGVYKSRPFPRDECS